VAAGLGEEGDVVAGALVAVVAAEVVDAAVAQALDLRIRQVLAGGDDGDGRDFDFPAFRVVDDEQDVVHGFGVMINRLAS
jgi:hypothetical protein